MTQEQIDLINKVVWFIPFKNKRNTFRNFLNTIMESINIIQSQNQQIIDINNQITGLTQHIVNQNQQITDLTQHSVNQNQQIIDINNQITGLTQHIANQNQQITDLTQHSINQNQQIIDINNQITGLTQHIANQNQQITDLTQHSINQNQQITDLTQHIANQNQHITNLAQHSINQNQQITDLTQHSINQNQQITDLTQHSINQNQQITDLTQHSINQNQEIVNLTHNNISLNDNTLTSLRKYNNETLNYIFSLKKELLELKNNKNKSTKKVVYTCLTGRYDSLFVHTYIDNEWDYICFTDDKYLINAQIYGNWIIKPLEFNELDNTRNNRWHKLHPHIILKDYDISLYIDSNIDIITSYIFECIDNAINNGEKISIPKHYLRDCLYREADVICENNVDSPNIVKLQMKIYRDEKFPEHYGLAENNCIYRKHNDEVIINTMEEWWYWVKNYSKRDQLSLFYALWKNNIKMDKYLTDIPIRYDFNNFNWFYHKKTNELLLEEGKKIGFV